MGSKRTDPGVGWSSVLLGLLMMVWGSGIVLLTSVSPAMATFGIGTVLILVGVWESMLAVRDRDAGWWLALVVGLASIAAGAFLLTEPSRRWVQLGLLIGAYMVVAGPLKLALAAAWRPAAGWQWMLFNGLVTIALGIVFLAGWPGTARWALGVFFGVDVLTGGIALVAHGLAGATALGVADNRMVPR